MSAARSFLLVMAFVANLACAERFGASNWFVLVAFVTIFAAWGAGLLDGDAAATQRGCKNSLHTWDDDCWCRSDDRAGTE